MMDVNRETHNRETHKPDTAVSGSWPANDNQRKPLSFGRSAFPEDAVARIFRPSRSAMTSGTPRTKGWRLVFERRSAPFLEPLMGYTGSTDTLTQVELEFPTLESAIRYAERQGLTYRVQRQMSKAAAAKQRTSRRTHRLTHVFSDPTLQRLSVALQESYGQALDAALQTHVHDPARWPSPADVVGDRTLTLQAKRTILMNWAWTEYLVDQAINEGMPENNRPSRLHEVEQALLDLERDLERRDLQPTINRDAA
ncbi:ETC complex I subunit [Rhizobium laguerreae]|uniref:ETC complex I subunit n=1 Tax=Rhizobium TaxID=379 RepID=UPI001039E238|nr:MULTISPECIES: ETC complex I subunit [Rhizobium]MBY3278510.1 ETC complex I subunit [Rhizobium laguerreae]MBY3397420.1 ETC complex I subunit [Rhizobium laguerreae]MBY3496568.1 ETC complex I subunit [Rhizobium laguerreae]NKM43303.1 NADH-ubiquinone oxidoreductase [Rhizobium laguerreae]TBZ79162.1 NADH-ubiquinone oxidoreductase [Rhizobium leguminosarum bv. viciae]